MHTYMCIGMHLLVYWHVQPRCVGLQLLHGTAAEGIASRQHDLQTLAFEPEAYLCIRVCVCVCVCACVCVCIYRKPPA